MEREMCISFHKHSYNSEKRISNNNITKYLANPKKSLKDLSSQNVDKNGLC